MLRILLITVLMAGVFGGAIVLARTFGASDSAPYTEFSMQSGGFGGDDEDTMNVRHQPRGRYAQILLAIPNKRFRLGDAIQIFGTPLAVTTCYRSVYVLFADITLIANASGTGRPFHPYMPIDSLIRRRVDPGMEQQPWRGFNTWRGWRCE
jgi:hypothetical protein